MKTLERIDLFLNELEIRRGREGMDPDYIKSQIASQKRSKAQEQISDKRTRIQKLNGMLSSTKDPNRVRMIRQEIQKIQSEITEKQNSMH